MELRSSVNLTQRMDYPLMEDSRPLNKLSLTDVSDVFRLVKNDDILNFSRSGAMTTGSTLL